MPSLLPLISISRLTAPSIPLGAYSTVQVNDMDVYRFFLGYLIRRRTSYDAVTYIYVASEAG